MSSVAVSTAQVDTRPFWFRRLHSLVGVVPLAAWVAYHFFFHSASHLGAARYDAKLAEAYASPGHTLFAIVLVYLPLLYHSIYGLVVTKQADWNGIAYPHFRNWMYNLQRLSGIGLLLFIPAHLVKARFPEILGEQMSFAHEAAGFASPLTMVVYALGILGAAFHVGNGLFNFTFHWGLVRSERAQRNMIFVSLALFVILTFMGFWAILGFTR